jgi:hypothetical protein
MEIPQEEPRDEKVEKFLARVIDTEQVFAFTRRGEESARLSELRKLLEEFCN